MQLKRARGLAGEGKRGSLPLCIGLAGVLHSNFINPCPAEPGYALPLQTVQIQINWPLKKPTDLDRHCLPFSL